MLKAFTSDDGDVDVHLAIGGIESGEVEWLRQIGHKIEKTGVRGSRAPAKFHSTRKG